MELTEYQQQAERTDQRTDACSDPILMPLLGLSGEVGSLLGEYKKWMRDGDAHERFRDKIADDLGDILWYCASAASRIGLSLEDIAAGNLAKTRARWLCAPKTTDAVFYDSDFPAHEQFPREFEITFATVDSPRGPLVQMTMSGDPIGHAISDRAWEDVGYRWHDALHLAFLTCLGWSPIMRGLMGRRRRSNPQLNMIEDGGRALVLDEGIVAFIFDYARRHRYLDGVTAVDDHLLKNICSAVTGLEVESSTPAEWEQAILQGFAVFRGLRANNGGVISGDLHARTLTYLSKGNDDVKPVYQQAV